MSNLTDEDIIYILERAAQLVREDLNGSEDGGPYDRRPRDEDAPQDEGSDPWGADTQTRQTSSQRGSQRSSGSSRGAQDRSSPRGSARGGQASSRAQSHANRPGADVPESGGFEDSRGKLWEFGLENAPSCDHRMPAAYVTGTKQKGGEYHAWACPIGFTDNWKDKCDLWEFTT